MMTLEKTKNIDYSISNDALSPQKILFERLANKWFLLLLSDLSIEPRRFNKLLKSHNGLSQKMLSQTLKNLEEDGLLSREVNGNRMPVEVTYSITPFGISLLDIVKPLFGWSNNNIIQVLKNRKKYAKKYNAIDK
jgi:Predicted transcriptional regulators